jgi:hypothetical protein
LRPSHGGSPQYACFCHDRANEMCGARSDVDNGAVENFRAAVVSDIT